MEDEKPTVPQFIGLGTHLFFKVYLDQETVKWPFRSWSQAATCYYQSNHLKLEAIPLSALPKDTTSELADLLSSHYPWGRSRQPTDANGVRGRSSFFSKIRIFRHI